MKKTKCYIYTRVSTAIQVDGYSLDAQKDKIRKYAEFQDMEIVGEYSDEGHSGKNIKGRPEFMKMLNDIEDGNQPISLDAFIEEINGNKDNVVVNISDNDATRKAWPVYRIYLEVSIMKANKKRKRLFQDISHGCIIKM